MSHVHLRPLPMRAELKTFSSIDLLSKIQGESIGQWTARHQIQNRHVPSPKPLIPHSQLTLPRGTVNISAGSEVFYDGSYEWN
jgi:hypothetical protein